MNDLLSRNAFLVKEHVGLLKAANNFDIHDPSTGEIIMECREENLGFLTKLLRFTDYKRMTPFDIEALTSASKVFSSRISTFSSCAFASLLPGSLPATT